MSPRPRAWCLTVESQSVTAAHTVSYRCLTVESQSVTAAHTVSYRCLTVESQSDTAAHTVTVSHSSSHSELARSLKAVLVCTSSSRASKLCWFVQALYELVPARSLVRARPRSKPRSCAGLYVQLRNSTARATVQYSQTRSTTVRQSVHGHDDTSQLPRT